MMTRFLSKSNSNQKLDFKVLRNATIVLILCIIPMSYVHEIGHAIICVSEGNYFQISMGVDNASLICLGTVENTVLFYAFGGFFAMGIALVPFVKFSWMKNHRWAMIVSLTLATGHGINGLVEVALTDWYLENGLGSELFLNFTSLMLYFVFLVYFGRQK